MTKYLYTFAAAAVATVILSVACSGPERNRGEVEVDFLWVRTGGERVYEGGVSRALLKVEKSTSGIQVGVFESKPGGTGDLWRSAMWMAALTGTLTIGKNPLDYRYSVETETLTNRVDGPSHGGLFAVAIMAALTGRTLDAEATMTGAVNPDGSIGPVGGIVRKLIAARSDGKKRFCYPLGQRFEPDPDSGELVDIQKLAEQEGVEVREVEDLAQAFRCMTGKGLKRASPVERSAMALSDEGFNTLKARTETWLKRSQEAYTASLKLAKSDKFESLWETASSQYDDASELLSQGLVSAAYWKAVGAYVSARTILLAAAMVDRLVTGDPVEALKVFSDVEEGSKRSLDQVFAALAEAAPDNVSRTIAMLDSYEAAISALVGRQFANAEYRDILLKIKESVETGDDTSKLVKHFAKLHEPFSEIALAEVNAQMALDNLALAEIQSGGKPTKLKKIDAVARLYQGAASANIEYFNAIFVNLVAEAANKPPEAVIALLLDKEPSYRTAQFNLKMPQSGKMEYARSGLPASLAKLAGALSSYFASSTLVAKFYSIGVKMDEDGDWKGVEREKAFIASLALAEEKARENAALARKYAGTVPESAKIAYQIGMVLRDRTDYEDKLDALEHFWRSSVWSQVAVYLARLEKN